MFEEKSWIECPTDTPHQWGSRLRSSGVLASIAKELSYIKVIDLALYHYIRRIKPHVDGSSRGEAGAPAAAAPGSDEEIIKEEGRTGSALKVGQRLVTFPNPKKPAAPISEDKARVVC